MRVRAADAADSVMQLVAAAAAAVIDGSSTQ
jgi:hypothetical protein